jgi:sirohydrochlorin cobaltochelatase
MSRDLAGALAAWLEAGYDQIGEVRIHTIEDRFELLHYADEGREGLHTWTRPEDARALANLDAHGTFRPLKTAPNLRRGWRLVLPDLAALRRALDYFYPATLGALLSQKQGELTAITLRETLARQSGMYAVTRKISDEQANELIGSFCKSERGTEGCPGCLKTILWRISSAMPITSLPAAKFDLSTNQVGNEARILPMLCHEACNLLVSKAREAVKKAWPAR